MTTAFLVLLASGPASAQAPAGAPESAPPGDAAAASASASGATGDAASGSPADHEALRRLKADVVAAINNRDLRGMDGILHRPFTVTVVTQDHFSDTGALQSYYDGLFRRPLLRLARVSVSAEADELARIETGTFAIARGSSVETYEMADGRRFDLRGRWTATAVKDGAQWKLAALHDGTSFLDNPVLAAVEKSTAWFGAGGLAAGLLLGFGAGWLVRARRA